MKPDVTSFKSKDMAQAVGNDRRSTTILAALSLTSAVDQAVEASRRADETFRVRRSW
jgi:hypothetical protein